MKQCNKCKNILEESGFYKDKSKKDGLSTCCIECRKQWKRDNKPHIAEYNKNYEQENGRTEKSRARKRASVARRHEYYLQLARDWTKNNPDRVKVSKDRDYAKNRESYIQRARLRRVREENLRADYTCEQWLKTVAFFDGKCAYCGTESSKLTQEHVIPVVKFGEYTNGNIIPACFKCNGSKHDKDMIPWFTSQDFFSEERLLFIENYIHICQSEVKVS